MSDEKRLFFVTVGTTAAVVADLPTGLETKIRGMNDKALRNDAAKIFEPLVDAQKRKLGPGCEDTTLKIWVSLYGGVMRMRRHFSAEITSTLLLLESGEAGEPICLRRGEDRAVLLASDTGIGLLCARINARVIHDCLFLEKCACGGDFLTPESCKSVSVEVITGLEANKAFHSIPKELRRIVEKYTSEISCSNVHFNVTGGFKGTIPSIAWLCYDKGFAGIFYQHEDSETARRLYLVPDGSGRRMPEEKVVAPPLEKIGH